MFPEGTRSPDAAIQEFKSGAGYLALRSGCEVLPIGIAGTHDVLGKGRLLPQHRPVEVRIGQVISNAELRVVAESSEGLGAYRKAADFLRNTVEALVHPPRRTVTARIEHKLESSQAPEQARKSTPARGHRHANR